VWGSEECRNTHQKGAASNFRNLCARVVCSAEPSTGKHQQNTSSWDRTLLPCWGGCREEPAEPARAGRGGADGDGGAWDENNEESHSVGLPLSLAAANPPTPTSARVARTHRHARTGTEHTRTYLTHTHTTGTTRDEGAGSRTAPVCFNLDPSSSLID